MQALSTAAPGKVYTIKWMFGLPEVLDIIRNCQIEEGSEIRVFEKFNGGLIIGNNTKESQLAMMQRQEYKFKVVSVEFMILLKRYLS